MSNSRHLNIYFCCSPVKNNENRNNNVESFEKNSYITKTYILNPKIQNDINKIKNLYSYIPCAGKLIDSVLEYDSFIKHQKNKTNKEKQERIKHEAEICVISTCAFSRRYDTVVEAFKNKEYIKALGKGFIQILSVHEDWRDVKSAFKQLIQWDFKKNETQKPFAFIRDTFLYKYKPFYEFAEKYDKTLFDFKISKWLLKIIGLTKKERIDNSFKFYGNPFAKVTARAFTRIPVLSLGFLSLLEIPTIINKKDHIKQIKKSTVNVTSVIFTGAFIGAIGAYLGPIGSLLGLGIGTYLGNKLAQRINKD